MRILIFLFLLLPVSALADERISTIAVHGEATTRIAPDQVTLPVTVHEQNISLKAAKEKHDDKLRKLMQLASDSGIEKDDIKTSYTSVQPVYDYDHGTPPRLRGYEIQTSIDFTLRNISSLGDFMNKIIDLRINELGGVSYSLRDQKKVEIDTLAKAVDNAYEKASRIAAEAKVSIDKAILIQEGNAEEIRPVRSFPRMMNAAAMAPASPAPELPAGLTEVRQDVTITYQLK